MVSRDLVTIARRTASGIGTAVKDRYQYGYDRASNREYRLNTDSTVRSEFYTYDGLHRLTNVKRGVLDGTSPTHTAPSTVTVERDYGLDAVGNWKTYKEKTNGSTTLNQQREHNKVNEMDDSDTDTGGDEDNPADPIESTESTPNWKDPTYDDNGNMITGPKPGDEDNTEHWYLYDAWNRLKVVYIDGNDDNKWDGGDEDTLVAKFEYDGLHRRIVKIVPNPGTPANRDRTDYYYNTSWQVLEEKLAADVLEAVEGTEATLAKYQYVWSPRYIDAPVLRDADTNADGDCTDGSGGSERLYYCTDANMNVTALIKTDGTVAERYAYDPYGQATFLEGDWDLVENGEVDGIASAYDNEILYCGYRHDPETGLYHVRRRPYHPTLGRWLTRDPKDSDTPGGGYHDGMNLYGYCVSSPVNYVDWVGMAAQKPKPLTEAMKAYKQTFKPWTNQDVTREYWQLLNRTPKTPMFAKTSLGALLRGDDKVTACPKNLTLPKEVNIALRVAQEEVAKSATRTEWGGVVTVMNGKTRVWGPIRGFIGKKTFAVSSIAASPYAYRNKGDKEWTLYNYVGTYHVHAGVFLFQDQDWSKMVHPSDVKMARRFSILSTCHGEYTWVLVRLGARVNDEALKRLRPLEKRDRGGMFTQRQPKDTPKASRDFYANFIEKQVKAMKLREPVIANVNLYKNKFCFYERTGMTGALTLKAGPPEPKGKGK